MEIKKQFNWLAVAEIQLKLSRSRIQALKLRVALVIIVCSWELEVLLLGQLLYVQYCNLQCSPLLANPNVKKEMMSS